MRSILFVALFVALMASVPNPSKGQGPEPCRASFYSCMDCGGHQYCFYGGSPGGWYMGETYRMASCTMSQSYCYSAEDCYMTVAQVEGVCPDGTTSWSYLNFCCFKPPWW